MSDARRGRVFIVQDPLQKDEEGRWVPKFDLTPAAAYGDLTVLLPAQVSPLSSAPTVRELQRRLKDFNDDDYLLAVGAPTLIGWATALAASSNRGRVKMLVWDRSARAYLEVAAVLWGRGPKSVDPLEVEHVSQS